MEKRQASKFYPYFGVNERPTIDQLVGLFNSLIFKGQAILTDFLDPGQREILRVIVGKSAFVQDFGGYPDAEKRRAYLSEEWVNLRPADYQVTPFTIEYPKKFAELSHSSILGTLANSGVALDTFGDIITDGQGKWQFMGKTELTDFFTDQIDRIGRTKVKVRPISFKEVLKPEDDSQKKTTVVASLRLDALLSGVSHQSRSQIKEAVAASKVKLNWHEIQNSNIMVKENDVLSLRHFGRLQVIKIAATKKGKYKVVFKLWQTKRK